MLEWIIVVNPQGQQRGLERLHERSRDFLCASTSEWYPVGGHSLSLLQKVDPSDCFARAKVPSSVDVLLLVRPFSIRPLHVSSLMVWPNFRYSSHDMDTRRTQRQVPGKPSASFALIRPLARRDRGGETRRTRRCFNPKI